MSDPKDKTVKEAATPPDDPREPYPTGNPPEAPTFADFHPQEARALELEKEAAKPATKAEPAKAPAPAVKTEPEEDDDDDPKNRYGPGKGRK